MGGTVLYGTGDVRFEDVPEPKILKPTDAIIRISATRVTSVKKGQLVIGSFFASDNTCQHCKFGYQSSCQQKEYSLQERLT